MKKRLTALLLTACFAAAPLTACGNDSEKEIKKLTKEIEELQEKCEELESDLSDAKSAIDDMSDTIDDNSDSIEDIEKLVSSLSDYIADLEEAFLAEPTADKSGGDKKNHTNNDDTNSGSNDNPEIYPLKHGATKGFSAAASPVDDEKIAPAGDKIPDDYEPKQASDFVMWLDISEKKDFIFNGETILVTMKIKKDAPDGVYPIVLAPDLSDVEANKPAIDEVINGSICINSMAEPFDGDSTDDFVFYGDSVSCKPGDTVEFNINIANNPGLAAFCIYMYYDSNAIEIQDAKATGEFKKINDKY